MKALPNNIWEWLIAILSITAVFVALKGCSDAASAGEAPPEAQLYYRQQMEGCRARVSLLAHINQVVDRNNILDLQDFEEQMKASGALPPAEQAIAMEYAELYFNSVQHPGIQEIDNTRIAPEMLMQFVFNTCQAKVRRELDQYMRELEKEFEESI